MDSQAIDTNKFNQIVIHLIHIFMLSKQTISFSQPESSLHISTQMPIPGTGHFPGFSSCFITQFELHSSTASKLF
ncbi:hypothetical protein BpHYR1_006148 [Brachionus plicatilis]|uniref:Uncharacterized protein n=1 Tax=Brachionus plicatilis TaxID=10195 RepID=A0A3M7RWB7_BRAPC|nr:hypothetical protein BpHYR1_006148 [Brachionus plicatilis]